MNWHFINTGFNTGTYNMAFDLYLSKICRPDDAFFRLYQWKPYCISLGMNQSYDSINLNKTRQNDIDIVKRPTGGRAILHAEELTYSVVIPIEEKSSPRKIYHEINAALASGLKIYDNSLSIIEQENSQPDFRELYKNKSSDVCFAVPAKSELKFNDKKLVGSAQHKFGNIILQHGSILCGDFHKKISDYLNISDEERKVIVNLLNKTADLQTITGKIVDYELLSNSLVESFESHFKIKFDYTSYVDFSFTENELNYS